MILPSRLIRLLVVNEDVLHDDGISFHAGDFRDLDHFSGPVREANQLQDDVDWPKQSVRESLVQAVPCLPSEPWYRVVPLHRGSYWHGWSKSTHHDRCFIACSMSSASPPRTSPTMIRSGPHTQAVFYQVTLRDFAFAPRYWEVGFSSRTTWSCFSCSSAESFNGQNPLRDRCIVLGEYIEHSSSVAGTGPLRRSGYSGRVFTAPSRIIFMRSSIVPSLMRSFIFKGITPKRLIESTGPSMASGGMMALTREPSIKRAST